MKDITILETDGWIALYIDGTKVYSNHSITNETLLDFLNISYDSTYVEHDEFEEYGWVSDFPDDLEDVEDKIDSN